MSMTKNYYVIGGYDLVDFKTEKYDDWRLTEQGERYTNYHKKDQIQLFDDPMSYSHLYFGYIFASGDEYDFDTVCFNVSDIEKCRENVNDKLVELVKSGIINKTALKTLSKFQLIAFEECT